MKIQQETENCAFYSSIYSCTDSTTKTFDQWIKKHTLIFYFSISTCQPCLESICDEVKLIFPDYTQREDIVFVADKENTELLKTYLKIIQQKYFQ